MSPAPASAPAPKGPSPARTCVNRRFREEEGRFIRCGGLGGSERGGPETGVATPLHLSRPPPPPPPGPDSVDICAIARPGGNQIIFKPEIIFFIIVTDSIFFLFRVTRCVCTYIYIYIINIKEIIYLSWDGQMREGGVCGAPYSSSSSDQLEEGRRPEVFLLPTAPALGPSSRPRTQHPVLVLRRDTQGEERQGRVCQRRRAPQPFGGRGVVRRAWRSSSNNTGVAPPSWGRGSRVGCFSGPLKALLPRSRG